MADKNIRIMLPVDGRILSVTIDDSMTGDEVIAELLTQNQIQPNAHGYQLGRKGGDLINRNATLSDLNLTDDDVLTVIPATDAGRVVW